MATLKAIRKRIDATKSTKKLTRAMKMISAAKLRKAQNRVSEMKLYHFELQRLFSEIIKKNEGLAHPFMDAHKSKTNLIDVIILTSDKGLCGQFNENLLKSVLTFINDKKENDILAECYVLGKKGQNFLQRHDIEVNEFQNIDFFTNNYVTGAVDETILVFNKFHGVGKIKVEFKKLLPIEKPELEYSVDYIYEPQKGEILDWILKRLIKTTFELSLLESNSSEQSARMYAMEQATKNAEGLITKLVKKYNQARQSSITKELLDIVGTVEALK